MSLAIIVESESLPCVSIIVPMRNEERYIRDCLTSLVNQDYPGDKVEIIVVDGMSEDHSSHIVSQMRTQCPNIKLLANPQRTTPSAFNIGIRHSHGQVIAIVSAHATLASDYIRRCVTDLAETGADNVGGPMRAASDTWTGKAIVLATSSPFGVGGARFHYAETPGWVDTVYMGAYRREVFDRIGLFDEELVRNQDDEFNFRLTQAGGKIWLDPKIRSTYFSRSTLHGLWKQYFEYGFWKVRVIQKHRRPASWRHLVPGAFVLALLGSSMLSLLFQTPLYLFTVLLPYLSVSLFVSFWLAAREGWRYAPILPLAFATMHLAYGIGFLAGIVRFGSVRTRPEGAKRAKTLRV